MAGSAAEEMLGEGRGILTPFRESKAMSKALMKLLDDPCGERCHLIFLAQGAMARRQTDRISP